NEFLVSVTLISVPTQLVLDTGTNSTNLSWKTWEKLARVWTPKQIVEGIARAGNPTSQAILVCLPSLQLGNDVLSDQAVRAQQQSDAGAFSSEEFGGILGSDILQQLEITFDLKNNRIFLRPDTLYKRDPYRYVTVGIQKATTARADSKSCPSGKTHQRHGPACSNGTFSKRSMGSLWRPSPRNRCQVCCTRRRAPR